MNMTTLHIAIVEDNDDLRDNLEFFLRSKGHIVWGATSAESFRRQRQVTRTDIALIDLGLPGDDGLSIIRELQAEATCGLIVITARGAMQTRLEAMSAGADHFLVKPLDLRELYVTIEATWRRLSAPPMQPIPAPGEAPALEEEHIWAYNPSERTLTAPNNCQLPLSNTENRLIGLLTAHAGELLPKPQLLQALYSGEDANDFHRVEVVLNRLRQKARQLGLMLPIRAVFGKGLVFAARCCRSRGNSAT